MNLFSGALLQPLLLEMVKFIRAPYYYLSCRYPGDYSEESYCLSSPIGVGVTAASW